MRRRLTFLTWFLAVAMMLSTAALAFNLLNPPRRWFPADLAKDIIVDDGGMGSVASPDPDGGVTASLAAVKEWNTAPGGPNINILTSSSGPPNVVVGDNLSHLVFGDPFNICKGMCLAATTVGFFDDDQTGTCDGLNVVRITDSDVFFNTRFNFTTETEDPSGGGTCSNEIYLESVVTHEVGHVIGLGHSGNSNALMAPSISSCNNKPLSTDDTAGRDALYDCLFEAGPPPPPPACDNDGLCESGENCQNCPNDCDGESRGRPSLRFCCGDGVAQEAEGDGTICDGNF